VPLSNGQSIETFYDYGDKQINSPLAIYEQDTSQVFLWSGPNGLSLVFLHDKPESGSGGAVTMRSAGLPTSEGEWVVKDGSNDQHSETRFDWSWGKHNNDGGAYRGGLANESVTIFPAFNGAAKDSPNHPGRVTEWQVLTGQATDPRNVSLDMDQPVTIEIPNATATNGTANLTGDAGIGGIEVDLANRSDRLDLVYQIEQTTADPQVTATITGANGTTIKRSLVIGTVGTVRRSLNVSALADGNATVTIEADGVNARAQVIAPRDSDGDGLADWLETRNLTMPLGSDSGETFRLDPYDNDTDGDGLPDGLEVNLSQTDVGLFSIDGTEANPVKADTDGDGLTDGEEETVWGSNPRKRDTDDDGYSDFVDPNISTENNPPNVTVLPYSSPEKPYRGDAARDRQENDLTVNEAGFKEKFIFNATDETGTSVTAHAYFDEGSETWKDVDQSNINETIFSSSRKTPVGGDVAGSSKSQYAIDLPKQTIYAPQSYNVTVTDEHGNGYVMNVTPNKQPGTWFEDSDNSTAFDLSVGVAVTGISTTGTGTGTGTTTSIGSVLTSAKLVTYGTAAGGAFVYGAPMAYVADQNRPSDGYRGTTTTTGGLSATEVAKQFEVTRTVSAQGRQIDITEAITISEGAVFEKDGHTRGYGLAYMAETTSIEKEEQEDDTSEETDDEEDTLGDVIEDGEVTTDEDGDIQVSQKTKERLRVLVKEGSRVGWELLEENLDDSSPDRNLQVSYLDVGKGTAILVDGPSNNMLIDAGGTDKKHFKSALDARLDDDDTIHTVVVSHNHSDHYEYLDHVLNNYDVNRVYFNNQSTRDYVKSQEFENSTTPRALVLDKNSNTTVQLGLGARATIAHLDIDDANVSKPPDANSLITRVSYRGYSFLMTGDIRKETEETLMASDLIKSEDVDVLKAPHHGTASSSKVLHSDFLDTTNPGSIVISNRNLERSRDHPNCGVFDRISKHGSRGNEPDVYWTALHDDVEYVVMAGRGASARFITPETDNPDITTTDPDTLRDTELTIDCNN